MVHIGRTRTITRTRMVIPQGAPQSVSWEAVIDKGAFIETWAKHWGGHSSGGDAGLSTAGEFFQVNKNIIPQDPLGSLWPSRKKHLYLTTGSWTLMKKKSNSRKLNETNQPEKRYYIYGRQQEPDSIAPECHRAITKTFLRHLEPQLDLLGSQFQGE